MKFSNIAVLRVVVAHDDKRGIGKDNQIPWHIPEDLKNFKQLTLYQTVIMGRNTWESIENKPLKDRINFVVSTTMSDPGIKNVKVFRTLKDALKAASGLVWIIGGGLIYKQALKYTEELYITRVEGNFKCDVKFPIYDKEFKLTDTYPTMKYKGQKYHFEIWERIND